MAENFEKKESPFNSETGSIKSKALWAGASVIAGFAIVSVVFKGCSGESFITPSTELDITAESVAEKVELADTIDLLKIDGTSSTDSTIDFNVTLGIGPLSRDVSIGSAPFSTRVGGSVLIKLQQLNSQQSESSSIPQADNLDKNIRLLAGENGKFIVQVDPKGLEAVTQDLQVDPGYTNVSADGLVGLTRSIPIEITEQITSGSREWNNENFKIICAQHFAKEPILKAAIKQQVLIQIQNTAPVFKKIYTDENTNNPEIANQIDKKIAELSKPENIEVYWVADPNSKNPQKLNDISRADFVNAKQPDAELMAALIGLKGEYIERLELDGSSNKCNVSDEQAKKLAITEKDWSVEKGNYQG